MTPAEDIERVRFLRKRLAVAQLACCTWATRSCSG